jgi:predicted SnoaL-like aldol condensation-catalyzing enzyme
MTIYKLALEDFDEIDYNLIAIHASQQDYRLAYKINQELNISLRKNSVEIGVNTKQKTAFFSRFSFEDNEKKSSWDLIQNKQIIEHSNVEKSTNLFENEMISNSIYLLTELKKVDFFLKISQETTQKINKIISKIQKINFVETAYEINANQIKSKNNLIF